MVFLLPAAAPKKLDIDFIPFLSTLANDFCAAVNFVLIYNKTKNQKTIEWKDMTKVRIFLNEKNLQIEINDKEERFNRSEVIFKLKKTLYLQLSS